MSLNWNANVKDQRAVGIVPEGEEATLQDKIEWAKTEHIIFASMVTGLGPKWAIREEDVDEVFDRLSAYEHAVSRPVQFLGDSGELVDYWLTREDIVKRVGLGTNASWPTRTQYERKLGQLLLQESAERRRHERWQAERKAAPGVQAG